MKWNTAKEKIAFNTFPHFTEEDLVRAQTRLLEMAKLVCGTLEKNGFDYFIISGTLLGAVRHQGFIPWDEDFDLFLFDDTYDAAVECVRKTLPEDMCIQDKHSDPIYWPAWAKVRDLNTDMHHVEWPDDNVYKFRGLHMDLYRCKKVPRDMMEIWRKKESPFMLLIAEVISPEISLTQKNDNILDISSILSIF